ncbi:hypothetical protein D9M73_178700 [compost metagenome]
MPGVCHSDHLQAGIQPIQRHTVSKIIVGRQHQLLARCHTITAHIGRHRTGQHVARHVVVAVHQRPLVAAGGQHHALGPDPVHALAHLANRRAVAEVVGQPLVNGQEVVVVIAVDRGPGQQGHIRQFFQFGDDFRHPLGRRLAVELLAAVEQAAAELFLLIGEDHPRPGACSSQGRG